MWESILNDKLIIPSSTYFLQLFTLLPLNTIKILMYSSHVVLSCCPLSIWAINLYCSNLWTSGETCPRWHNYLLVAKGLEHSSLGSSSRIVLLGNSSLKSMQQLWNICPWHTLLQVATRKVWPLLLWTQFQAASKDFCLVEREDTLRSLNKHQCGPRKT